jgi:hypothetical protein
MSAPALPTTKSAWPTDLLEFARKKGVEHQLDPLLELARRMYPGAPLRVALKHDLDEGDLSYIQFEADVSIADHAQFLTALDDWDEERLRMFPGPDACAFVFLLRPAKI